VRPSLEYATTSWGTAAKTHKSRLDKVQNTGLRLILGAMKSTPVKEMEKTADVEPLDTRRERKVLMQCEKMKRLPTHPLHNRLQKPLKTRLKRQSINHQYKQLKRQHRDILDQEDSPDANLRIPDWRLDHEMEATITCSVPGIFSIEQPPAVLKTLSLAMIEDTYPSDSWAHVYTDGSADEARKNGGSGVYIKFPDGEQKSIAVPGGKLCSNFKAEMLAIHTAAEFLLTCKKQPQNICIFTDSLSVLQSLQSIESNPALDKLKISLSALNKVSATTLQWVPAHVGLPGNEQADQLAKAGSQLTQPSVPATYEETKTLIRSKFKAHWEHTSGGYCAQRDPLRKLDRDQQTLIFRLRTGHCRLRAHLKRIGVSDTSLCICEQADETVSHMLQDCCLHEEKRREWWPEGKDLSNKLWGSVGDLTRTASFTSAIKKTI